MKKNKLKLLFEGRIITSGLKKNSNRSGVFFTAINLLKEFALNKHLKVVVYCKEKDIKSIKKITEEFHISNVDFLASDIKEIKYESTYKRLKNKRGLAKSNGKFLRKVYYQIRMGLLAPFYYYEKNRNVLEQFDAFFSALNVVPEELTKISKIKKFTMLHDVIPLVLEGEEYEHTGGSWFIKLVSTLNDQDYYICNSEYTKQDFIKHVPQLDPNKMFVSLLACNKKFYPRTQQEIKEAKQKYNIKGKYVFALGNIEPRKNLERIIRSFLTLLEKHNIDDLSLVIAGTSWTKYEEKLYKEMENAPKYKDKIILTGYLDDEDVAPLFSGAQWAVYTSQYEGFGLPALEAMSCGCPLVASNCTSLPEVTGDTALSVDWDSDEQHLQAFETYYFNENVRKEKKEQGLKRAKLFSWKKCAATIVECMLKVCK